MAAETARPSLLIVDDAPANLRLLVAALQDDYAIRVASDGEQALALVAAERPDLILLDVVMPGIDGHEVCRRLKADPFSRDIPVIFISGRDEEEDELHGLKLGAVDYIVRPFSLPIVRARIVTHIEFKRYRDRLEALTWIDGLTGVANRRRLDEYLRQCWALSVRQGSPLASVLLDVDQFKAYNDHYGHLEGDDCLIRIASTLAAACRRPLDLVARYGGEEFACLLPDTDLAGALGVAESLRVAVAEQAIAHARSTVAEQVTISLGVAAVVATAEGQPADLLALADAALYRAKRAGGNRVSV